MTATMQVIYSVPICLAYYLCSFLFSPSLPISDLDVPALARGFGLLHLPSMPELKGKTFTDFVAEDIDYNSIPYL